ncbi:MAG: hypothetical protein EZS28_050303 [Streblomastix strix]|uniref:RING-type domain-containing protein n=1 Tax=Streblomastix strix TaxID=222440 RepID=A0A5J4T9G2_9EUKA|nr:MAG: hypothetical protein EZS28_050303 [Streblomastix strix]
MVIFNAGFGDFNLETSKATCPLCEESIVPVKPAFSECIWRIDFQKPNGVISKLIWNKAEENQYITYDQDKSGMAEFTRLIIQTKKLQSTHAKQEIKKEKKDEEEEEEENDDEEEEEEEEEEKEENVRVPIDGACGICHKLKIGEVSILKCSHSFHTNCIPRWKERGLKCPHCGETMEVEQNVTKEEEPELSDESDGF